MMVDLFARIVLGLVFLVAAAGKLRSTSTRRSFTSSLVGVGVGRAAGAVSIAVVAAESLAVVLLIVPHTVVAGYLLSMALLAAFVAGITRVVHSGRAVSCQCFGAASGVLGVRHLVRNALLILIAGAGLLSHASDPSASLGQTLLAAGAGAVAVLLVLHWDDLAYMLNPPETRR